MDAEEYLLFIPLLIYGIVLSRLLGEWRRFFDFANWHGPYIVTVVVFTEIAIWNIFNFLDVFRGKSASSYLTYLALLLAPFLFLLSVNALLEEEDRDGLVDREEFASRMRLSYALMACFVALHLLPMYRADDGELIFRLPALVIVVAISWLRKEWLVYLLGAVWLLSLLRRIEIAVGVA
jgi:hypothetical protein